MASGPKRQKDEDLGYLPDLSPGGEVPGSEEHLAFDVNAPPTILDGSTRILDSATLSRGLPKLPAGKLIVASGPKVGEERSLGQVEMTIGRGNDNDWSIADISMSRRHLVVKRGASGFSIRDQGSGNGTLVNGERLEGEHLLRSGDVIEMGDTVMRFQGAIPAPSAAKRRSMPARTLFAELSVPRRRAALIVAGLAGAFAVMVVVVSVVAAPRSGGVRPPVGGPVRDEGAEAMKRGLDLFKAGKYPEARPEFERAASLLADSEEARRYSETAAREAAFVQKLEDAEKALVEGRLRDALDGARAVEEGSPQRDRADAVRKKVTEALSAQLRDARGKADVGEVAAAHALLEKVMAVDPASPEALALRDRLDRKEPPKGSSPPAVARVQQAFAQGKIRDAIRLAAEGAKSSGGGAKRCTVLGRQLRAFDTAYQSGIIAAQGKKIEAALEELGRAQKLHQSIAADGGSPFAAEIARYLGSMNYLAGLQAKGADDVAQAGRYFEAAVQADPQNALARKQLAELKDAAHSLFLQTYIDMTNDPARARKGCLEVMQLTPKDDPDHQKCQKFVQKQSSKP